MRITLYVLAKRNHFATREGLNPKHLNLKGKIEPTAPLKYLKKRFYMISFEKIRKYTSLLDYFSRVGPLIL